MQKLLAVRLLKSKRVGNWSGAGAGKTLSAVLASRVCGAKLTVICCPNNVIPTWVKEIVVAFPDSRVETKTFHPTWSRSKGPRYLVLNYEMFQQPGSEDAVRSFAAHHRTDLIVIDEIHYAKHRNEDVDASKRRTLIGELERLSSAKNPGLRVLGMSSTPVINELYEGKSLVELVSGSPLDVETTATVANCMKLHRALMNLGVRWVPNYSVSIATQKPSVDCSAVVDEISESRTVLDLELALTKARLPEILKNIQPKTFIYTHLISGIDRVLQTALEAAGWKVGFFTGDDKEGLDGFLHGDIDVLIGTSAIGTGVDGLQSVCQPLIFNVLPWTSAEFDQIKGRVYRQGQKGGVTVIIPVTHMTVDGERWSWCDGKIERIEFKRSIADAAVDGVVPKDKLRSPTQAYRDTMEWLKRLGKTTAASK